MIPQMEPSFGQEEADALHEYIMSGGWCTEFKKTQEFEFLVSEFIGGAPTIAVNNGTVTLILALLACEVGPGDEVIVPDYTMIATPNAVRMVGATPILVDIEKETLCLDIEQAKKAVTEKTKAIMYVSLNGRSGDLDGLAAYCKETKIYLIEDSAQSLGSYHNDKHLGTIGDIGSFSFSAPKIISTGQGGMLTSSNEELVQKIRLLKDFGRTSGGNDIHDTLGYNFKFTDLQAVVGIEQMKRLKTRMGIKKSLLSYYKERLCNPEIEFVPTNLRSITPWFVDIYVDNPFELSKFLREKGVGSRLVYPAIHTQKIYQGQGEFPVASDYCSRGLWLPSSPSLTLHQVDDVISAIKEFFS